MPKPDRLDRLYTSTNKRGLFKPVRIIQKVSGKASEWYDLFVSMVEVLVLVKRSEPYLMYRGTVGIESQDNANKSHNCCLLWLPGPKYHVQATDSMTRVERMHQKLSLPPYDASSVKRCLKMMGVRLKWNCKLVDCLSVYDTAAAAAGREILDNQMTHNNSFK